MRRRGGGSAHGWAPGFFQLDISSEKLSLKCVLRDALQELGLECANWTPEVYHDLIRSADGTEEGIIRLFFDKVQLDAAYQLSC